MGTLALAAALMFATGTASAGGGCPGGDDYCFGPTVTIKKGPKAKAKSKRATFKFVADNPKASFRCKLDRGPFRRCESPKRVRGLDRGAHVFAVQATVGAVAGSVTKYRWKVVR